jgi:hypothetical protein
MVNASTTSTAEAKKEAVAMGAAAAKSTMAEVYARRSLRSKARHQTSQSALYDGAGAWHGT